MKYYLIAGEASGDLHGANLMRALLQADLEANIRFWGGDQMAQVVDSNRQTPNAKQKITQVRHIRDLAYMGFIEVALHCRTIFGNIRFCKQDLLQFAPDAIIYIDYPGFNLKIAKFAHTHGLRNFHYISPQLWAWKKGRIRSMRRILDRLYCILPFEQDFYARNNFPQARFVGHPLLDAIPSTSSSSLSSPKTIALLPGSRRQELHKMLPPMLAIARRHPDLQFSIAGMTLLGEDFYNQIFQQNGGRPNNVTLHFDATYDLLAHSHAALVCSGTATLETALFNVPQVVCYRANALSIAIARFFVGKRVKYISLVNLIADQPIVRELIQADMDLDSIDAEFTQLNSNNEYRQQMIDGYAHVRQLLGGPGASSRVINDIITTLNS